MLPRLFKLQFAAYPQLHVFFFFGVLASQTTSFGVRSRVVRESFGGRSGSFGSRSGVVQVSNGGRSGVVRGSSGVVRGSSRGRPGVARCRSVVKRSFGGRLGAKNNLRDLHVLFMYFVSVERFKGIPILIPAQDIKKTTTKQQQCTDIIS